MQYRSLGSTDIQVSLICLGTMTWGQQNSQAEAHLQLDYALDNGVNFIDTAEMYSVPTKAETQGSTETIIGNWLAERGHRDQVILTTKVAGRSMGMDYLRGGPRLDRANIESAIDNSLRRLQTDYLDLYQVHWPDRQTNYFGQLEYQHDADAEHIAIEETLTVLAELVASGKVRHLGISNETPWGAMRWLQAAQTLNLPRVVSIQNPYSLLNRSFEIGLAEVSHRESIGLLAYSPMAFGTLSGKYIDGTAGADDRVNQFPQFARYTKPQGVAATREYVQLARDNGLDPGQMALAFVNSRPFLASTIIGATSMAQLESNIGSAEVQLSDEVLEAIQAIHTRFPNPCP
ncbi:MAG: NADP(H)-dependent aldo-keto reductase [Gammaproteobacteria bacterium]|nr:MAG: NADP(H)-dependent aldo-keto reductase [Gammaproteobacteria bacterium]